MHVLKAISLMFSKVIFPPFQTMGAFDLQGVASLDLGGGGLIGRIYVGTTRYCYILNIYAVDLIVAAKYFQEQVYGCY